ncbi:MAG: hypothetical protein ACOX2B_09940 [Syntrophothermaceae bacterium]
MKKTALVMLAALILIGLLPGWANAVEDGDSPRVYMLLVDRLSVQEFESVDAPNITYLLEQGSLGLMNTRTLGSKDTDDACITIGAGTIARSCRSKLMGFNVDDNYKNSTQRAADVYQGVTGYDPGEGEVVLVNLPQVVAANQQERVNNIPGALGDALQRADLKTCVLGNSDFPGVFRRNTVGICMNSRGVVDYGEVGEDCRVSEPGSPGIWETNYPFLLTKFNEYQSRADFIVVELPDLGRLERGETTFPGVFSVQRQRIVREIDDFIGSVLTVMHPQQDLLMLVVPTASIMDRECKNTLTPLIIYGKQFRQGVLNSPTTKRDYICANIDLAPTVLDFFHITDHPAMTGQLIDNQVYTGDDKLGEVVSAYEDIAFTNQLRVPLVKGYVGVQIVMLLMVLFIMFFQRRYIGAVKPLVYSLSVVPLVFLLMALVPVRMFVEYVMIALAAIAAVTAFFYYIFDKSALKMFLAAMLTTVVLLNLDIATGAHLIKSSVLGYDLAAGARYYGIGNEFMGVLLGTTVLTGALLRQQWRNKGVLAVVGVLFALEVFMFATPTLGANAGGTIAAASAFLLTFLLLSDWKIQGRSLLGIATAVALLLLVVAVFDMNRPPALQSHIGRAANMIVTGGWQEAYQIIARKLAINLKLIRYTIWSRVFLATLVTLAILLYRPPGVIKVIRVEYPYVLKGIIGVVAGAFVALVFNDSGIVAAATATIFAASPLLYLALEEVQAGIEP